MNDKILWSVMVAVGLSMSACGAKDDVPESMTTTPAGEEGGESETDNPATGGPQDTDGPVATTGMGETGPGGSDDESGGFIAEPDGGGISFECDMFAQDCPEGEKCMPWANDGSNAWNATRCSPISENPGQPGDSCQVEGSGVSGLDNCDIGSMCWDVDPETNIGTCIAMCTGDESNPICEDPDTVCAILNDGAIVLCLESCDPLLQNCAEGQACYPIGDGFSCVPDASGEMGTYSDPCEFINACDPGLMCLGAAAVPNCVGSGGCCSEVCDLVDPTGDAQCSGSTDGQTCQPWYEEGAAPPGYENVGACALPA